uniref:Uncharacterized protein n=1 Tax=Cacopsylla melanoneura TaxID=428564 RepID=A0A8D8ZCV8_9HEMI
MAFFSIVKIFMVSWLTYLKELLNSILLIPGVIGIVFMSLFQSLVPYSCHCSSHWYRIHVIVPVIGTVFMSLFQSLVPYSCHCSSHWYRIHVIVPVIGTVFMSLFQSLVPYSCHCSGIHIYF